jgi:hypothetical protein
MDRDTVGPLYPVLTAMLRRDPRQRPDAAEVRSLLTAVAEPAPDVSEASTVERPRSRFRPRWLPAVAGGVAALALVLSLVISSDDGDVGGDARNTTPASGESRSLIGDPRTADLCALADPDALVRFGDAEVDPEYRNFDSCDVLVSPDADTRIDVQIQFRRGLPPETSRPTRTVGSIGLQEEPEEDDDEVCAVVLLPIDGTADGVLVRIRVQVEDGTLAGGIATLCAMADAAAESAAEILDRGPIPRRSPAYPDESLAWANACELLDADSLSVVPGILDDAPDIGVANWTCKWYSEVDKLETELRFYRDEVTKEYGEPMPLGPYNLYVVRERNGPGTCAAFVPYRSYGDRNAATAYEMLRVYVGGQRPVSELCGMATDLITSAAAELPPL